MAQTSATSAGAAGRYAKALADLAEEAGALDAVERDLEALATALDDSEELSRFIRSPLYKGAQQRAVMHAILDKAGAHALVRGLIDTLIANRRLALLPAVMDAFRRLLAERRGELEVVAITAEPMSAAAQKKLAGRLKDALQRKVDIVNTVDPDIIGGLVLRIGSRMIDASVRHRLDALKSALKGV